MKGKAIMSCRLRLAPFSLELAKRQSGLNSNWCEFPIKEQESNQRRRGTDLYMGFKGALPA